MRKIIFALALVALTSSSAFAATAVDRAHAGASTVDRTHATTLPK
jgi:hypothetical protein